MTGACFIAAFIPCKERKTVVGINVKCLKNEDDCSMHTSIRDEPKRQQSLALATSHAVAYIIFTVFSSLFPQIKTTYITINFSTFLQTVATPPPGASLLVSVWQSKECIHDQHIWISSSSAT